MAASQDSLRDLLELATVHSFCLQLLEQTTGHPVPIPRQLASAGEPVEQSVTVLRNWLDILDMAISPVMLRDAMRHSHSGEAAECLLRYYVKKACHRAADRDKADFAASYLYRHPSQWRNRSTPEFIDTDASTVGIVKALEFEKEILFILGDAGSAPLPQEHQQLLREFEFLYQEVEDLRHFDALMDSGIVQRVREMKAAFGESFYHPLVLANVAVYNTFFGAHFDKLFTQAAQQIKTFAAKTQQEGASLLSRVEGDVTVKNLAEVQDGKIHEAEYGTAQEEFRKVSKFKKAVDKLGGRPAAHAAAATASAGSTAALSDPAGIQVNPPAQQSGPTAAAAAMEQSRVRAIADSIRNFVRAAERGADNIVPLRGGNVVLTPAEVEAYRSDFGEEKSFRADCANVFVEGVALHTRMMNELADYKAKRSSAYLWKPHADSLTCLLSASGKCLDLGKSALAVAEQRGLADKAKALTGSMDKLRAQMSYVAKALQG
jgi:hypothetical protein